MIHRVLFYGGRTHRRPRPAGLGSILSGVTAAIVSLGAASPLSAQQSPPAGPISPDSADVIRDGLVRPPAKSPVRAGDIVAFPFSLVGFTLGLAFDGVAEVFGLVSKIQDYESLIRPYRKLVAAGIRPGITTDLGPRSGLALSVVYDGLAPLTVESAISTRGSLLQRVAVTGEAGPWSGTVQGQFQRHEEEHFWGIGLDAPRSARADFRHDRFSADGVIGLRPAGWATLSAGLGIERTNVRRGGDTRRTDLQDAFDPSTLFGATEDTRFVFFGGSGTIDLMRWRELQEQGIRMGTGVRRYVGIDGTASDFTVVEGVIEALIPITARHTVALAGRTEVRRGNERGVPFTHLGSLGGAGALRAFEWGRFRDRDLLVGIAEWRYEIWRDLRERGRVEAFTFWEEGGVARTLGDLPGTRSSYGFGMLLAWNRVTAGRWWVAHGSEGTRISASISATLSGLELTP